MADRDDRMLAACYRAFGKAAQYVDPDGTTTNCTVCFIRDGNPRQARAPIDPIKFAGLTMHIAEGRMNILVRATEIAQPATDGVFTLVDASGNPIAGQTYTVAEAPMLADVTAKEWRCPVPFAEP